jgi:Phage tail tube protein
MALEQGVASQVAYKVESSWGVDPGDTGATYLRRVTCDLGLDMDSFESSEIVTHYQFSDVRKGMRRANGSLAGEFSLTSYKDFLAAVVRKAWVAGVNSTALTNVTASDTPPHFVRAAGSWLTDGFKVGDVIQWAGWTAGATGNNARNYRITALTGTDMTVADLAGDLNTATVTDKASGDSVTATVQGYKTMIPATGHTNLSYTIERRFPTIGRYHRFNGVRIGSFGIDMPASGMARINFGMLGKDMVNAGTGYFTTPAAAATRGIEAAVNGKLSYDGTDYGIITSANLSVDCGLEVIPVIGSNYSPDVFQGRIKVTGSMTALFEDDAIIDDFLNDAAPTLMVYLSEDSAINGEALGIVLPRVKLTAAKVGDAEKSLPINISFQALYNANGGSGIASEQTSIVLQDTAITP